MSEEVTAPKELDAEEEKRKAALAELKKIEEDFNQPVKAIPFTNLVFNGLTEAITSLYHTLADVATRSDLISGELDRQQEQLALLLQRIEEIEKE